MGTLDGKIAIVTGTSRGVGVGIAQQWSLGERVFRWQEEDTVGGAEVG